MEYIKLEDYDIEFKNLISGPAQVGRILNYLILVGNGKLHHKNGNRKISLFNNVASSWCSEFMIGLGLIYYLKEEKKREKLLYLTEKGKKLFDLIKNYSQVFDESDNSLQCRTQLIKHSRKAYKLFKRIFIDSPIYINLYKYIKDFSKEKVLKADFINDYYEYFLNYYDNKSSYNRNARVTTGGNRVPSLIQLCEFFELLILKNSYIVFKLDKLNKDENENENQPKKIDEKRKIPKEIKSEEEENNKIIEILIKRYGINGNVVREIITRNSTGQKKFRKDLFGKYGCKCAICNKDIDKVLIASHIVPASQCDVYGKIDDDNGLLLCALHDKLFDNYLISFNYETGKIMYSKSLEGKLEEYQLNESLILDAKLMTDDRKEYLKKHNEEFERRNK